jgi:hypothetical protein
MLEEQDLQNRFASRTPVYEYIEDSPNARKKKRPVTPGVPARED